jgi:hypothetical protein
MHGCSYENAQCAGWEDSLEQASVGTGFLSGCGCRLYIQRVFRPSGRFGANAQRWGLPWRAPTCNLQATLYEFHCLTSGSSWDSELQQASNHYQHLQEAGSLHITGFHGTETYWTETKAGGEPSCTRHYGYVWPLTLKRQRADCGACLVRYQRGDTGLPGEA